MASAISSVNVRKMLMVGAVVGGAVWIGWLGFAARLVNGRGREDRVLWEWLGQPLDFNWPGAWPVVALLLVAVGGKLVMQDPPRRQEGAWGWLVGFLGALAVFVWMLRGPWREPAATMIPVMVACGIAWMSGAAVLRFFQLPVVMTLALFPPQWLVSLWMLCRKRIYLLADGTFKQAFGSPLSDVPFWQVRWVEYLPSPLLTLMGAALFCWAVRGWRWVKILVVLPALAHLVLDVCFNNEGC